MFLYRGKIDLVGSIAKTGGAFECKVGRILSTKLYKPVSTDVLWTPAHDGGNECEVKYCGIEGFEWDQQVVQTGVETKREIGGRCNPCPGRSHTSTLDHGRRTLTA